MSNPFIQNIPTDNSIRISPQVNTTVPPNPSIVNYPLASTGFNSGSTYLSSGGSNASVTSLNTLQNAVTISSANPNLTITEVGNDIELTVLAGGIGVETLNNLVGAVTVSSTNGNLTVAEVGNDIQLTVLAGGIGVESLESLAGNIGLTSTGNTVAITTVGNDINLEASVNVGVTSVESVTGAVNLTSTGGTVGITTSGQNINLETLGITPVSDWSQYPATQNVDMVNHSLTSASTSGISVDSGVNPITPTLNLTASNGIGGKINITANNGVGGTSYGAIDITANGGTTAGFTSGGSINIIATTPAGSVGLTGKVNINGAGINSYAGALPTLGSLTGYNFVHGDAGVNITAGIPPIVPSDPLCVYLYGTNGNLMYGSNYMTRIRPYSDLTINPSNLVIEAYSNLITTGYVDISGCSSLVMTPTGQISIAGNTGANGEVLGKSGGNLAWVANGGGAGVSSLNSLTGAITLTAGTNISLVPVGNNITINQINVPVTNRASGTTPLLITATTFGTAQTIANLSLTTSAVYDINVTSVIVLTSNTNSRRDMNLFVTINGVQVGQVFTSTISGIGHFLSMPQQCSQLGATAGAQTILLKGYADTASDLTVNSFQISATGNLA